MFLFDLLCGFFFHFSIIEVTQFFQFFDKKNVLGSKGLSIPIIKFIHILNDFIDKDGLEPKFFSFIFYFFSYGGCEHRLGAN